MALRAERCCFFVPTKSCPAGLGSGCGRSVQFPVVGRWAGVPVHGSTGISDTGAPVHREMHTVAAWRPSSIAARGYHEMRDRERKPEAPITEETE